MPQAASMKVHGPWVLPVSEDCCRLAESHPSLPALLQPSPHLGACPFSCHAILSQPDRCEVSPQNSTLRRLLDNVQDLAAPDARSGHASQRLQAQGLGRSEAITIALNAVECSNSVTLR